MSRRFLDFEEAEDSSIFSKPLFYNALESTPPRKAYSPDHINPKSVTKYSGVERSHRKLFKEDLIDVHPYHQ